MKYEISVALIGANIPFCFSLKNTLLSEGYTVSHYFEAARAIKSCKRKSQTFCIITGILSEDTVYFIHKIRSFNHSIIIIAVEDNTYSPDRAIMAFKAGADIYQAQPFSSTELLHRMKRMVSWTTQFLSIFPSELTIGDLHIKDQTISTTDGKGSHRLTLREMEVITMLAYYKNRIVNRSQVMLAIWGTEDYFLTRSLDVIITRLRASLKLDQRVILETIHGIGFRLTDGTAVNSTAESQEEGADKSVKIPAIPVPAITSVPSLSPEVI